MSSPRFSALRKWAKRSLYTVFLGLFAGLSIVLVPSCSFSTPPPRALTVQHGQTAQAAPVPTGSLRLLSLNLAHARKDGFSQLLTSTEEIRGNLGDIAAFLQKTRADVVALQEADGNSFWNGSFDHVQYLADQAGFGYAVRGEHMGGFKLSYGTALLSELPLSNAVSVTFPPSPPTPRKGFVYATVQWPGAPADLDVVSVHLDFLSDQARLEQVREIVAQFTPRQRPLVVLGDFNTNWAADGSAVRALVEGLGLQAYQPESTELATFPLTGERLDWILLSPELRFVSYQVLPDVVSDHRSVLAEVAWQARPPAQALWKGCNPSRAPTGPIRKPMIMEWSVPILIGKDGGISVKGGGKPFCPHPRPLLRQGFSTPLPPGNGIYTSR